MMKQQEYEWEDSNLALFGSDVERNVKKESAEAEPAWKGAGEKVGLKIWRIVKFKVTDWAEEDYGSFFNGDSYIVLNTYKPNKDNEELAYDVHFWIGKHSTQDEYGTAAYKTVELDTYLDDVPVQHREVEAHESDLFKSYFKEITTMEGGAETGFKHVTAREYKPKLLHVRGNRKFVTFRETPFCKCNLTNDDCFIIDRGLVLFQWNGVDASKEEKWQAGEQCRKIRSLRGGKAQHVVLDDCCIEQCPDELDGLQFDDEEVVVQLRQQDQTDCKPREKVLYRLSDREGNLKFEEIARGCAVKLSLITDEDVFILDTGRECVVYVGEGASVDERRSGLAYAHNYLMKTDHPLVPVNSYKCQQRKLASFCKAFE